jgi:two-component system CheB/CheR fusion protein
MVFAAFVERHIFFGGLEGRLVYVTFYPAVAIAAIVGGPSAGALATILSAVLAHLLVESARGALDWIAFGMFLLNGALIVAMAEVLHAAQVWLAAMERNRQNERHLRLFIEQAPVAMAMFDQNMRYLAVSDRWIGDYLLEERVIGRSHYDVFPNMPSHWREIHRRGLAGEIVRAEEDPFVRRDGAVLWLKWEIRPWRRAPGDIGGTIISAEDITERRHAQAALAGSEARYKAIVDTAVDAIVIIDEWGNIQSLNPAAQRIFGYAPDEMIGRHVNMFMPASDVHDHHGYLEAYHRHGIHAIIGKGREVEGRRKDGTLIPLDLAVTEWRDGEGRRHFTGLMRDISERKRSEQELANARRLEAVGQLASGVAHDFNNLLAVIAGNLELAERRVHDEPTRLLLQRALEATEMGGSFNRRLLSLARKRKLEPKRVNLNERIEEASKFLTRTLGEHVQLRTELAPDLWTTIADAGEVDSALLNLATNARDAMPNGGNIVVTTSNVSLDAESATRLHAEARPGDFVCIAFADNGADMSKETLARAMEPFFTTKEPGKGTGLGLSSVYSFAKQTDGFVVLASVVGQGTTVSLYLPRAATDALPKPAENASALLPQGDGELILVVEDDDRVREVTLKRLEVMGYAVAEARSGPEAIDLLANDDAVQLVLSDIAMPGGMSGYDLAGWVRETKPGIKVLLSSGYDRGGIGGRERDSEIVVLSKPYTREQLAHAVRKTLDEAQLSSPRPRP